MVKHSYTGSREVTIRAKLVVFPISPRLLLKISLLFLTTKVSVSFKALSKPRNTPMATLERKLRLFLVLSISLTSPPTTLARMETEIDEMKVEICYSKSAKRKDKRHP